MYIKGIDILIPNKYTKEKKNNKKQKKTHKKTFFLLKKTLWKKNVFFASLAIT
jgi:hypothetical protein